MATHAKNTICLWYDRAAEDAARFYAKTFPDSFVNAVHLAPGDYPSGKKGDVLTGIRCDDADEKDRHRGHRSGTPRLKLRK